jgi:hypothetical protein
LSLPVRPADLTGRPTTPPAQPLPGITRRRFGLFRFRSPLLTESRLLSLPAGNEMFHFPAFPPHALCVQAWVTGHDSCRVSPFGHPRISARLAAPRGLSQPPTSFIGSWCQGIHRAPLLTWPQRCSRPLCSSQGAGGPGLHPSPAAACCSGSTWTGPSVAPSAPPEGGPCSSARSVPSGPNSVPGPPLHPRPVPTGGAGCTGEVAWSDGLLVSVPPLSSAPGAIVLGTGLDRTRRARRPGAP